MEFLKLIEDIKAEEATIQRIFTKEDGVNIKNAIASRKSPQYMSRLTEAAILFSDVYNGKKDPYFLKEAMTTSDFPLLFADIIDRQILAGYQEAPITYPVYTRISTVRDFRSVSRKYIDGGDTLLELVGEQEEYKYGNLSEGEYKYAVKKYGKKFEFSWELMINDDFNSFADLPARLGRSARRSEEYFVTSLYIAATGPNGTLYSAGNKNRVTGNPILSVTALQTAMTLLSKQRDASGLPIYIPMFILVVPPALEVVANNIVNALQIFMSDSGGTTTQQLWAKNWLAGKLKVVVNPYIPMIATSNADTSWFLFCDPSFSRGAIEIGFLRGYAQPQVFMKASDAILLGTGGMVDPMQGSFENDSIEYKIRHVFGGTLLDYRLTIASDGKGS